jgi:DNA replication protein DnaC
MEYLPKPDAAKAAELLREQRASDAEFRVNRGLTPVALSVFKTDLGTRQAECPSHGAYQSSGVRLRAGSREIWSQCPACADEERAQKAREELAAAERRKQAERDKAIGEAQIPVRFQTRDFASFQADTDEKRKALSVAQDFAQNFDARMRAGAGLIFAGLPGTGKSHLAAAIMLDLVGRYSVRYITCMALIRAVRDTWRKDSEWNERAMLRHLCHELDLLVIDEVGVQYGTDGEQTVLFEILDRRYSDMRPTILLTNQDKDGFKSFVGDRVFDRLRETARWVPFDWPSFRGQAREAYQ